MKTVSLTSRAIIGASLALCFVATAPVSAAKLPSQFEDKLVGICEAVQADDRTALRKAMKNARVSYQVVADKLVCNGQDVMTFAAMSKATHIEALLVRRTSAEKVSLTAAQF